MGGTLWNSSVEEILENQWKQEEVKWMENELHQLKRQANLNQKKVELSQEIDRLIQSFESSELPLRELTNIERAIMGLVLKMGYEDQMWLLEVIFNRYRT